MRKEKGFTLIELLAVITILALILLISAPTILGVLKNSRKSSAEDATLSIVKSAKNYTAIFMLNNEGLMPNKDLEFICDMSGCKLQTQLIGYNMDGLTELSYDGQNATSGIVKVTNGGKDITITGLEMLGFVCKYPVLNKAKCVSGEDAANELEILALNITNVTDESVKVSVVIDGSATKIEYSIDGINYQDSSNFTGLMSEHEYTIYVRATNSKKTVTASKKVTTLSMPTGDAEIEEKNIWTQSKKVILKYPEGNYEYKYKILSGMVEGKTVGTEYTGENLEEIVFKSNGQLVLIVKKGEKNQSTTIEIEKIDSTKPTTANLTYTNTENSLTITATGEDLESGIKGYQFSIDNGTTWVPSTPQSENTYTFNNLTGISYTIKIRAINNTYKTELNDNNYLDSVEQIVKLNILKFKEIAAGKGYHSLGIDINDTLLSWGENGFGQLGYGTLNWKKIPTEVSVSTGTKFKTISAGEQYSLAIDESGSLWAWGYNGSGKLGDGTTTRRMSPVQIKEGTKFKMISAGKSHSLAIDESGNLWIWGANGDGQLGDGTTTSKTSPIQIKEGTKFKMISAGGNHSLAIDESGNLWAWGYNSFGHLGDKTTTKRTSPVQIKSDIKFRTISAGNEFTLAIDENNNLWTWGRNQYGQLGNGMTTDSYVPLKIEG